MVKRSTRLNAPWISVFHCRLKGRYWAQKAKNSPSAIFTHAHAEENPPKLDNGLAATYNLKGEGEEVTVWLSAFGGCSGNGLASLMSLPIPRALHFQLEYFTGQQPLPSIYALQLCSSHSAAFATVQTPRPRLQAQLSVPGSGARILIKEVNTSL